jgi:imidazolonepropionase-like amidohydrolase|tara:strand:- start:4083 stop:5315 length:1233 start_codon:yes stop_codon:yes gene_type:complete
MQIAIKAKNIIDGVSDTLIKNKIIRVKDGIINDIVDTNNFSPTKSEKIFQYENEIIMPGMVDAHVHLAYSGITDTRAFRAESVDMDYASQALRGYSYAREHMSYGFTSLRDMNAPGNVSINIRDAINNNKLKGPNIKACGLGLSVTGGHMDQPGWGSHVNFNGMTHSCDGPHEFRKGVRTQHKLGADFIKTNICVSSTYDIEHPYRQEMTDEEIQHVCEEASMLNLKVASHTSGGRGITVAVKNGIHSVEHGHWLDNETIDLMAKNNTFYVPTLLVNERNYDFEIDENLRSEKNWQWLDLSREAKWLSLEKALKANINIALGTDAGFMLPHGSMNYRELEYLIKGGFSNMQAIRSATQVGGKLLGMNVGTLEIGQQADILVVNGNPLDDIKVLSNKKNIKVFKSGILISE